MMQKYTDGTEIRYFEAGVDVSDWIDLTQYRLMTDIEILKHETNPNTEYHIWCGTEWIDSRTEEEKLVYKRSQYPKLTRYQFKRCLLEKGYKSFDIEAQIQTIEDEIMRELTLLGFREAPNFVRTDSSVLEMQSVLGLSDENVDELWEYASKL
ncbi:hypothetical protein [Acinetobacter towneri]|uniref:hypothetical protein n=1 Tax=Acinetobacter towneri TaxID=202956 RepID=UPI002935B454|nr:hypothetical protein [Acinetobacter towneri]MDV2454058.1 hypothetical protein [Acinetobacter towneri]